MFAFVIWDSEKQTLFGARDFFGIKPFYYTVVDGNIIYLTIKCDNNLFIFVEHRLASVIKVDD